MKASLCNPSHHLNPNELIRFNDNGHSVQFYDDDEEFLFKMVANFLSPNLNSQTAIVVVGNQACRDYMAAALKTRGNLYDKALADGRIRMLDNVSTLEKLIDSDGNIKMDSFNKIFIQEIEKLLKSCSKIFAYGDLANLLVERNLFETAIQEEHLWNDVAKTYNLTLLCGYNLKNLKNLDLYPKICHVHSNTCGFEQPAIEHAQN